MRRRSRLFGSCTAALAMLLAVAVPVRAAETDPGLALVGLRVLDGVGWHADADFRLDWVGVAGEPPPRVLAVDYLVRDADGSVVVPTVRTESEGETLQHVVVPPLAGEYTAEIWLEGEGGEGPRSSAQLRFDPERPAAVEPLVPAGWVRAGVPVPIGLEHPAAPWPLSGIRGYAVAVDGGEGGAPCAGPDRCTVEETNLRDGAGGDSTSIGPLPEGTSFVRVHAVSGSGMRSAPLRSAALHADGTGPQVSVAGAPEGWSNLPVRVTARAADALSGMAPTDTAGARTTISVDGEVSSIGPGPAANAVVHGAGVHLVTASARDAVGNPSAEEPLASAVVRIDETAPHIAFAWREDEAEPERIEALLADPLSGPDPARGSIAVRAVGSRAPFEPIPTAEAAGRLIAVWDSGSYRPGSYEFEAIGYDTAGNRATTRRREGSARMVLAAPLKPSTVLLAGFGGPRALVQTCTRSAGEVRCHRHRVASYERRPRLRSARYGQGISVGGRLSGPSDAPLGDQEVTVIEAFDQGADPRRRTNRVRTGPDGAFLLMLAPGPSRRIRVEFEGTPLLGRCHGRSLRLAVRAAVHLRASAATATVGGAPIVFSGTVGPATAATPETGLPVELQFRVGAGAWSEFRTLQTGPRGRFRYAYAFADDDSRGVRFQFRAVVPRQPGWPFARGVSNGLTVAGR